MKLVLAALLAGLAACGYTPPAQPREQHAYCGSTCWNNSYCIGQGIACERCIAGVCSGSTAVAETP